MGTSSIRVMLWAALTALGPGCAGTPKTSPTRAPAETCGEVPLRGTRAQSARSPRPDQSAERLALRGTEDLVAGDRRYRRIAADLAAIRASGHPLIAQSAFARFGTQTLFLTLSTEAREAVAAGRYRGWDCLNEWYGAISHRGYDAVRAVTVHFSRLYHPRLIEQAYLAHPDVHRAEASAGLGDSDDIELHGEDLDGTLRYVFRGGGGDCASGCVNVHAQAFDVTPSGAVTDLGVRGGPTPPNRAECAVWPTHHCRSVPP